MPDQPDLVIQLHNARKLVETVTTLEQSKDIQKLDAVREFYASASNSAPILPQSC
jgi:hypothetical protein